MKINILRAILIILLICTFGVIFGFSSQDSSKSSGISKKITIAVTKNIKSIQSKSSNERNKILSQIESIIRKIAHFSIYTLVGLLLMALLYTYNIKEKTKFIASLIAGFIYAVSDEFHQSFVPRQISNAN